jgi:hypothetical protein
MKLDEIIDHAIPFLPKDCGNEKNRKRWARVQLRERIIEWMDSEEAQSLQAVNMVGEDAPITQSIKS